MINIITSRRMARCFRGSSSVHFGVAKPSSGSYGRSQPLKTTRSGPEAAASSALKQASHTWTPWPSSIVNTPKGGTGLSSAVVTSATSNHNTDRTRKRGPATLFSLFPASWCLIADVSYSSAYSSGLPLRLCFLRRCPATQAYQHLLQLLVQAQKRIQWQGDARSESALHFLRQWPVGLGRPYDCVERSRLDEAEIEIGDALGHVHRAIIGQDRLIRMVARGQPDVERSRFACLLFEFRCLLFRFVGHLNLLRSCLLRRSFP